MKKCEYCGEQFETNRHNQKYCCKLHYNYAMQGRDVKKWTEKEANEAQEKYEIARAKIAATPDKKEKRKFEIELIDALTDNGADIIKFWYDITKNNLIVNGEKISVSPAQMMKANEQLQLIRWGKPKQQSVPSGKVGDSKTQVNITMFSDKNDMVEGQIIHDKDKKGDKKV